MRASIKDGLIVFVPCLFSAILLEAIYPPASLPFIIIYYAMWYRFLWKHDTYNQKDDYEELLKQCKIPKGRWDYGERKT